ncbi:BTAD domain-containing putative transcriptional regulator [Amycolatopsis sp. NPDC059027]|uniref:AfsR/SARP family transcriptional regulator n=1 Tax=unclassified Amycolatopsis TaxID=2618356 RepID=UPI0036714390
MPVEVLLLGSIEVRVDGKAVELGHARQRSVLAALAVDANEMVPIGRLVDRIWGDHPPHAARDTLYGYLHRLRRAMAGLSGIVIERRSGSYVLTVDPAAVDLTRFGQLAGSARAVADDDRALALLNEALALWRGEALASLDTPWFDTVRRKLEQDRRGAESHRAELALRTGRHEELVSVLLPLTEAHPLDERLAEHLMSALHLSGRHADALNHYQLLRRTLVAELGTEPNARVRALHQRILNDEPVPGRHTTASPHPVPRQLPAAPPGFTGRREELRRLDKIMSTDGELKLAVLDGPGGIGKTWLALTWARTAADRFPDGHLFADLQGFSPTETPMDPATALRGFLTALGVDSDAAPPDLQAQTGLFRSLVAGKRMLVVLDNARSADQVAPLLPGSSACMVLITSRNRLTELLTRHSARAVQVDVLSDEEARQSLADRLGHERVTAEPDAMAALIARCGRFPLALGIVASRAAAHPGFALAALADELRDATTRLAVLDDDNPATSLPAVLSWSHNVLTARQARVFALLGLAPGPDIGLPAATALTGLPAPVLRTALRTLEDLHLIQQHVPGRWRAHDLIRLYAAERARHDLPEDERVASQRRLLDFYLHTAYTADRLLEPDRSPISLAGPVTGTEPQPLARMSDAMQWFTTEHPVLLAAQQSAAGLGWHTHVWQLAWALDNFHYRRGPIHAAIAVWRAARTAADHLGDLDIRVLALRGLGHAAADAHLHDEATDNLTRALKLAEQADDRDAQARTHHVIARVHDNRGDHRRALKHAATALDLYRTLDLPFREAAALNEVGWQYAQLGQYDSARTHCGAALELTRRHNYQDFEAASLDSLGYIAYHAGEHTLALEYYQQALVLYRTLGHTYSEAETLEYLGLTHRALGGHDDARYLWHQSVQLFRDHHRHQDAHRVEGYLAASPGETAWGQR